MGQKINPISLRLQTTNRHFDNSWYSDYFYKQLITKDLFLQQYLNSFLKLLKLPVARYSIQHLQKKTQVYNFLHYAKFLRQNRSKFLGLTKRHNLLKKNRYFFKKSTRLLYLQATSKRFAPPFKKFNNKIQYKKLRQYYTPSNQHEIYKIQKKITSFQNFTLWSTLTKQCRLSFQSNDCNKTLPQKSILWAFSISKTNGKMIPLKQNVFSLFINKNKSTKVLSTKDVHKNMFLWRWNNLVNTKNLWLNRFFSLQCGLKYRIEKRSQQSTTSTKNVDFHKIQSTPTKRRLVDELFVEVFASRNDCMNNLFFLQNLFVYKIYKSSINKDIITRPNFKTGISNLFLNTTINTRFLTSDGIVKKANKLYKGKLNGDEYKFKAALFCCCILEQNRQLMKSPPFFTLDYKYKNYLELSLSSLYKLELDLIPFKVENDWQCASYLAEHLVYFLEKRIPFRRLKGQWSRQFSLNSAIRGVRITCSGRVGGKSKKAQRAKTECLKYGQTSLHVFSSRIDFACKTARTSFGSVGVKVWICYN